MKLQVALDFTDLTAALRVANAVQECVDILEAGTPLIKAEGMKAVKTLTSFSLPVCADLKIMDVGKLEADLAFDSGAFIVTVCASAETETIEDVILTAAKRNGKVMIDFIGLTGAELEVRLKQWDSYVTSHGLTDVVTLCIHTAIDVQHKRKDYCKELCSQIKAPVAIAGGITPYTDIPPTVDVVIVGGYITRSSNPLTAAINMKRRLTV